MQLAFSRFLPVEQPASYLIFAMVAIISFIIIYKTISNRVSLVSIISCCLLFIMAALIFLIHGKYDSIFIQVLFLMLMCFSYFLTSNQSDRFQLPSKFWTIAGCFTILLLSGEIYGRIQLFSDITTFGKLVVDYEGAIHRLSGNTFNPNRWASSMSLLLFTMLGLIYQSKRRELLLFATVLAIYLLASISKTFFITLLVFLTVLFLSFGKASSKLSAFLYGSQGIFLMIGIVLLLPILTDSTFWESIIQASIADFLNLFSSDTFTARVITYNDALNNFNENILLGPGMNVYQSSPHNNLLAYVGYWGLLGFILFLFTFVFPFLLLILSLRSFELRLLTLIIFFAFTLASSMSSLASDSVAQVNYALCLGISIWLIKNQDFQIMKNAK